MDWSALLTPLGCRVLSDIVEGWNEHLNDGLECLADVPRDVGCFLLPMRVEMNISKIIVCVCVTVLLMVG